MKAFFKYILAFVLVPCMLFSGCTKNILLTVYRIQGNVLTSKQVKVEENSPVAILQLLKKEGVISNDTEVVDFKNEGSDTYRSLLLDLNGNFRTWLSSQDVQLQKLIMQAMANTYLYNYSADDITVTVEGQALRTGTYDFSQKITFMETGTTADDIVIDNVKTAEPTVSPEETPIVILTPTAIPSASLKPQSTPTVTPKPTPVVTPERTDGKKYVAMTFDDGPHSKYTTMLADKIKEYNAGATFFVIGNRVNEKTGPQIKYASENGCEIAIHAYTHEVYYDTCSDERFKEELSKTADVIKQYTGKQPTLMRPVGGKITNERTKNCGYSVIMWNVDSEDWKHKKAEQSEIDAIVNNVMSTVGDGKIILMHEIYENSYKAFCIIMEKLYAQGYEVVTVTDLLGKENLKPGTKFFGA